MKKFVIGFLLATFSICVFLASLPVRADSAAPKDEEIEPYALSNTLNVPRIKKTKLQILLGGLWSQYLPILQKDQCHTRNICREDRHNHK